MDRCGGGPPGGQEIIDDQHPFPHGDGVAVDRQRARAVLQIIFDLENVRWQLAGLSDRHESCPEIIRQRTAQDEATGFNSDYFRNPFVAISGGKLVHNVSEGTRILEQRRDIVKENPRFGKIRHFADQRFVIHGQQPFYKRSSCFMVFCSMTDRSLPRAAVSIWRTRSRVSPRP